MDEVEGGGRIASLFEDAGVAVLAEAGLTATWAELLGGHPVLEQVAGSGAGAALLVALRDSHASRGELRAAVAMTRAVVSLLVERVGTTHPDVYAELGALGSLARRAGRPDQAGVLLRQAWAGLVGDDPRRLIVGHHLAALLAAEGQRQDAEDVLMVCHGVARRCRPDLAWSHAAAIGRLRLQGGDPEAARPWLESVWEEGPQAARHAVGEALARVRLAAGELEAAVPVLRWLFETAPPGESAARHGYALAVALEQAGHREEAARQMHAAITWTRAAVEHPELPVRLTGASRLAVSRGRLEEAEGLLLEALEVERRRHGDGSARVGRLHAALGRFLAGCGRHREALGWFEVALGDALEGPDEVRAAEGWVDAGLAVAAHDPSVREHVALGGAELVRTVLGPDHPLAHRLRAAPR